MTLTSGTKLGRYEIRSQIGAGGMGEVYRAFDPNVNREVALKGKRFLYARGLGSLQYDFILHC